MQRTPLSSACDPHEPCPDCDCRFGTRRAALKQLIDATLDTVKECPDGAPAGSLYMVFQHVGMTLDQFHTFMGALVEAGKLRKIGHLYFAC